MSRNYKNMNKAKIDLALKRDIRQICSDFKSFMKVSEMPDFKIQLFDALKTKSSTIASVSVPHDNDDSYVLYSDFNALQLAEKRFILPTYYHEFTHILDNATLLQDQDYNTRMNYLSLYTEFHATLIQLQIATEFQHYDEQKILTLNSKITNNFTTITLAEYFGNRTNEYRQHISEMINDYSPKELKRLVNHLMYYIAHMLFAKIFVEESTEQLFDLNIFQDVLGDEVYNLIALVAKENVDLQVLQSIKSIDEIFLNRFVNTQTERGL